MVIEQFNCKQGRWGGHDNTNMISVRSQGISFFQNFIEVLSKYHRCKILFDKENKKLIFEPTKNEEGTFKLGAWKGDSFNKKENKITSIRFQKLVKTGMYKAHLEGETIVAEGIEFIEEPGHFEKLKENLELSE